MSKLEFLIATPMMHRFYVYNSVLIPEFCKKGHKRYEQESSHPIVDIFRITANKLTPNNHYKR